MTVDHVIIDTSYFKRDPDLNFAVWGDLVELQRTERARLYVPSMVVREQVRHQDDADHRVLNGAIKELSRVQQVLARNGIDLTTDISDVRAQRDSLKAAPSTYEARFRESLAESGVTVLPDPAIDSEDLADTFIKGRKPFKANGEGLGDYYVWWTVVRLDEILPDGEEIVLVTANSADFAAADGSLHPELSASSSVRARLFSHPTDYVKSLDLAFLASTRFQRITAKTHAEVDSALSLATSAAETYANKQLLYSDVSPDEYYEYGYGSEIEGYVPPEVYQNPTIVSFEIDHDGAQWNPYENLDESTVLGRLTVDARVGIEAYANKSDLAYADDVVVVNFDHNDHMAEVSDEVDVIAEFHIRIDGESAEVLNVESIQVRG